LNLRNGTDDGNTAPLTPPMSERASGDVEQLFSPEKEEHYESVDLSSEDEGEEWNHSTRGHTSIDGHEQVTISLMEILMIDEFRV